MTTYITMLKKIKTLSILRRFSRQNKEVNINMIQQAILHYKYGITHDIFSEPVTTYAKLSIDALEKQIPKRPVYDSIYKVNCCPDCGSPFTFYGAYRTFKNETDFCPSCGQAIDWSTNEPYRK